MKTLAAVLLALLLGILWACQAAAPAKITAVDDMGRAVYIEQTPQRVVSLAPSITETLFGLGLGDKVVGVTENCDYPEEAKAKPKVGGCFSTSLEAVFMNGMSTCCGTATNL